MQDVSLLSWLWTAPMTDYFIPPQWTDAIADNLAKDLGLHRFTKDPQELRRLALLWWQAQMDNDELSSESHCGRT